MSLMRWFRRNNRKIMAVAVVGLMVVFIGGSALRMSCSYSGPRPGKAIYLFGKDGKISRQDLIQAETELSILKNLRADVIFRSRDMHGLFLSELLFSEGKMPPQLLTVLRQTIRNQQLRISDEEIYGLYDKTERNGLYWHLLKKETAAAGIAISNETSARVLRQVLPNLFQGASYADVINSFIGRRISEENVLSTFGQIFAILEYTRFICSIESLTRTQLSWLVSNELGTLKTELVKFPAELFVDEKARPTEQQVKSHFEKYKSYYPNQMTRDNPFGFGYKLDDRVQLEYIIVKLDDIKNIIEKPTQQEKEKYYLSHTSEFTRQIPIDPNDPNSALRQYTRSFGEVARFITNRMIAERINRKTDAILGQAKQLAEEKYGDTDIADMTTEQLKEAAADFTGIAEKLNEEHSIDVYSGKTGLLGVTDMQEDGYLIGLFTKPASSGQMPHVLIQVAYSVEQLDSSDPAPGRTIKPKLYETLGPLSDLQGKIAAIVRIVDVQKAAEPSGLNDLFKPAKIRLDEPDMAEEEDAYTAREQVEQDLKKLAAMQTAEEKAKEFLPIAQEQGWEKAIEKFNLQYPPTEPNDPNNFDMTDWANFRKPSAEATEIIASFSRGLPGARLNMNVHNRDMMILETLFSLVPDDSNSPKELPLVLEVKPDLGYYCIKTLSVNRIDSREYDQVKSLLAFRQDTAETQSLGALHFLPENILKRMNFRPIIEQKLVEPNEPGPDAASEAQES